jgi:HAD superfamily hydrolase (TIGR01509 family)
VSGVPVCAVLFDIGGVLERVGPPLWTDSWRRRLGLTQSEFDAAISQVDPQGLAQIGGFSEAEMRSSYAEVFGLSSAQVDELMIDIWDWYCGELDEELVSYVRGLRPRLKTGIVSNSADGARREETRRYAFPDLVDDIVYSHEVGLAKPDAAIYALACERLGVRASEAALVDDVPQRGRRGSTWPTSGPARVDHSDYPGVERTHPAPLGDRRANDPAMASPPACRVRARRSRRTSIATG